MSDKQKRVTVAKTAMGRRTFLKNASLVTAGVSVLPELLVGEPWGGQTPAAAAGQVSRMATPSQLPPGVTGKWPIRPLMQEVFANSMDARYLAKPVLEFQVIDDMEKDRGWIVAQNVHVEYTTERAHEGTRSLRFRTVQWNPEYVKGETSRGGVFDDSAPNAPTIRLKFDSPQDWTHFNRLSIWCYVHPTDVPYHSLRFQIFNQGTSNSPTEPVANHFVGGFRKGEWNHLTWEIPEIQRDKVTQLVIFRPVWGFSQRSMRGEIVYDFDELRLERVEPKPYEGWQPAKGVIAFQHVGYMPSAHKIALMSGAGASEFQLLDDASGKPVAKLPVSDFSNRRGKFQVLDFTSFITPGQYRIQCGDVTSRSFPIAEDSWDGTTLKLLNYFYGTRCGIEVPGRHDACHLDTTMNHNGVKKCAAGGWHDAGNMTQGSYRTDLCAGAMVRFYERLRERDLKPELQARMLEEARWGLEWGLLTRFGDGYRSVRGGATYFTDNIEGSTDGPSFSALRVPLENFIGAGTAAHASRVLKSVDLDLAARLLDAAKDDFRAALEDRQQPPVQIGPGPAQRGCWRDEIAYGTTAAVELYLATGSQEYAAQAQRLGGLLLEMQEQRFVDGIPITGYYYDDATRARIVHNTHFCFEEAPSMALRALCDAFPGHADWAQWYAGVLLHSEFFLNRGSRITQPFEMVPSAVWRRHEIEEWATAFSAPGAARPGAAATPNPPSFAEEFRAGVFKLFEEGVHLTEDFRLRAFPILNDKLGHGNCNIQLAATGGLAAAAELRNAAEISNLVGRQLQWLFGGNPFSQTIMYGEGYDFQRLVAMATPDLVGVMPLGIDSHHEDAPTWTQTAIWAPKDLWVVTSGRTILALAHAALPGKVSGEAPAGATFHEKLTGKVTRAAKGPFAVNLAPGEYTIQYGDQRKNLAVLPGVSYTFSLDPKNALELGLSSQAPQGKTVQVECNLLGTGSHRLELRGFNCSAGQATVDVKLKTGQPDRLTWMLDISDSAKPWVLVVIPDGQMSEKREIFGTSMPIDDSVLSA
jgi:Glycosyl hydrolase family 9/Cellulase N-terminal ig-like domain